MTLETYKMIHIAGIALTFMGLGGVLVPHHAKLTLPLKSRILAFVTHGMGLLLIIISGFGMLARLNLTSELPHWVYIKFGLWLLAGLAVSAAKRLADLAWTLTIAFGLLAATAAYVALFKP